MTKRALLLALPLLSLAACGAPVEEDLDADESEVAVDGKADSSSTFTYYTVRQDYRRCVFPLCGGYWVKRVNSRSADEIYVAEMSFDRAGLDAYDLQTFSVGGSVVRGYLNQKDFGSMGRFSVFAATEVWAAGSATATPSGVFYRLTDKNLVCFRAPCFNIGEAKLNSTARPTTLSDITGALATDALTSLRVDDAILVAGVNRPTAQNGKAVDISAYWTRVKHYTGPTCATVRCASGFTCEMVEVWCIKAPCYPQPTCVATDAHLIDLAKAYAFAKGDASYTKRFFNSEAEAYAAAATTPSLLWVALDGANNAFVWGENDLWAERFQIDRTTGEITTTAEH